MKKFEPGDLLAVKVRHWGGKRTGYLEVGDVCLFLGKEKKGAQSFGGISELSVLWCSRSQMKIYYVELAFYEKVN